MHTIILSHLAESINVNDAKKKLQMKKGCRIVILILRLYDEHLPTTPMQPYCIGVLLGALLISFVK
jgi:hypothetical protein